MKLHWINVKSKYSVGMNVYVSGMLLNRMADIYIEYRLGRVLEYKLEVPETLKYIRIVVTMNLKH